jgi:quinol monooxygenase YgiN
MKASTTLTVAIVTLVVVGTYQLVAARGQSGTATATAAIYVVTHVDVMPKFTADGRELLKDFTSHSKNDPGVVRIETIEEVSRPNHSTIVEVWKDRKSFDAHLESDHTRAFRTKLQPMLGSPFDERLHHLTSSTTDH